MEVGLAEGVPHSAYTRACPTLPNANEQPNCIFISLLLV